MSFDWYVGMKVICIDAHNTGSAGIEEGCEYELARIGTNDMVPPNCRNGPYADAAVVVWLRGVLRDWDCPFAAARFRPVAERKTDISIFTELLTPVGQKKRIREDA